MWRMHTADKDLQHPGRLSDQQTERTGMIPYAHIVNGNEASIQLQERLGLNLSDPASGGYIIKKKLAFYMALW